MNKNNYIETEYNKPFIRQRADPYVYRHSDGSYYFTASVPEYDRIVLRRSNTLNGLRESDEVTIWKKHDKGIMSVHIWAPEIHYLDNKWFIYYAGGDIDDIWAIRPYVLVCEGQNPLNDPWKELGMVKATDAFSFNDFSLDMTVFENKGKRYCVWAEKVNIGKKISNLYIAEMKSPTELATAQVLLSSPDYEWERVGFWVNEGPAVIKHNGKIFLTYSASETGECYCMGMLSIGENEEILNPRAWKKECNPVLKTDVDKQIYGPGHNSFVKDETGNDVMIYHARQYDEIIGDPLYDHNRHVYRMKIKWNSRAEPVLTMAITFNMIFRKNKEEPLKQANIKTDRLSEKIKAAKFPYRKYIEDLEMNLLPEGMRKCLPELCTLDFIREGKNIIMTGNPGTWKTHTAIGLGIKACEQGYRVLYTTIPYLVIELKESNSKQKLRTYQKRFEKYDLIIADELGYISFDREAADLLFTVLSLRASQKSTIITSNLTFERWDEIFGDAAITSAVVDRLTYKAYLIDMEGDSYRLRETLRNNGTDFETVVK